ncbi:MAG: penicillin-binding transpeptidase domain-containing protein [Elusimicrobiota bacterium]
MKLKKIKLVVGFIIIVVMYFAVYQTYQKHSQGKRIHFEKKGLQNIVTTELSKAIENSKAKSGFVIVENPQTGEIVAIANDGILLQPRYIDVTESSITISERKEIQRVISPRTAKKIRKMLIQTVGVNCNVK